MRPEATESTRKFSSRINSELLMKAWRQTLVFIIKLHNWTGQRYFYVLLIRSVSLCLQTWEYTPRSINTQATSTLLKEEKFELFLTSLSREHFEDKQKAGVLLINTAARAVSIVASWMIAARALLLYFYVFVNFFLYCKTRCLSSIITGER